MNLLSAPVKFKRYLNAKKDAIKNIFVNYGRSVPVETLTTTKYPTWCCALCHISANSATTEEELQYQIDRLKEENKLSWNISTRASGETTCFAVTTPTEQALEAKLLAKGFKHIWSFKRRNGYLQNGKLKLWLLNVVE